MHAMHSAPMLMTMKKQPKRILLVEDNPDHAELIQRLFAAHDVENCIYHVTNGEDALKYLYREGDYEDEHKSPTPHLILLDLRLPKIDGLDVLKQIRVTDQFNGVPVVVLTSSNALKDIRRAYDLNANSYLLKPVDYDQFNRMIDEVGVYWLDMNSQPPF